MTQYGLRLIVCLAERIVVMAKEMLRRLPAITKYIFGPELCQQPNAVLRLCNRARVDVAGDVSGCTNWSVQWEFSFSWQTGLYSTIHGQHVSLAGRSFQALSGPVFIGVEHE